jgi:hypothetical protein
MTVTSSQCADDQEGGHFATAEAIMRERPQWLVLWGVCSRLYWGFALFGMKERVFAYGTYPEAVVARMDQIERRFRVWPEREGGE